MTKPAIKMDGEQVPVNNNCYYSCPGYSRNPTVPAMVQSWIIGQIDSSSARDKVLVQGLKPNWATEDEVRIHYSESDAHGFQLRPPDYRMYLASGPLGALDKFPKYRIPWARLLSIRRFG